MYNIVKNDETKTVGRRTIVNLNGVWSIGESLEPDCTELIFDHTVRVPGLVKNAEPPFEQAGEFESRFRQYCKMNIKKVTGGLIELPVDEEALAANMGAAHQNRNYFWLRREFQAPEAHAFARLIVLKARFGSRVWVNGVSVGEHESCFTSAEYDLSEVIRWGETNELVIRIGAHQGVLPEGNTCPEDCEHEKWYPGIWDDVELYCYNNPAIRSVQIASKIDPREILVETELENRCGETTAVTVRHQVKSRDLSEVLAEREDTYTLEAGEARAVQCVIPLPEAKLWSCEEPNLYVLDTSTGGDSELNRFGVRDARFRTETRRFHLNGNICYLRGGLITFERFLEDPLSSHEPWDEKWVRGLLGDTRRLMNWNATKYCLENVPRMWLDIADEEGLMGAPEFPIWAFNPDRPQAFFGYVKEYDLDKLKEDVQIWVRDNRNHPSVIYWSGSNETCAEWVGKVIIPTGRALDLQKRNWLNSYNPPLGPDDPQEDHPYEFHVNGMNLPPELHADFDMCKLELEHGMRRQAVLGGPGVPTGHAQLISEYGWLWLTRGGEPGLYVANTYHKLPYPTDTPEERLETNCYLLAALTEYWRAHRNYAQVVYNAWLAGDMGPGHAWVVDNFKNPLTLELQPAFLKYVREAFKPLGVYLEFFRRQALAGGEETFFVMMINDYLEEKNGELELNMEYEDGTVLVLERRGFEMGRNGSATYKFVLSMPDKTGKATLTARARSAGGLETVSQRWVEICEELPSDRENSGFSETDWEKLLQS